MCSNSERNTTRTKKIQLPIVNLNREINKLVRRQLECKTKEMSKKISLLKRRRSRLKLETRRKEVDDRWIALREAAVKRNPSKFWAIISAGCGSRKTLFAPPIAEDDWKRYIQALYAENGVMDLGREVSALNGGGETDITGPPTITELERIINSMGSSGAMGPMRFR
ncbi:hypothetical protein NDU88_001632 [Pleurodeles waltl]|uniref:Uncharacterized protein n=1 Tax=Pleurodeles waltl TaxID=8319 RepID=A0AAV7UUW1_PLEWA|nr:hypothetical protein NDU88_001632 [Pleurodeles waltl]